MVVLFAIWFVFSVIKNIIDRMRGLGNHDHHDQPDIQPEQDLNTELERMLRGDLDPASGPTRREIRSGGTTLDPAPEPSSPDTTTARKPPTQQSQPQPTPRAAPNPTRQPSESPPARYVGKRPARTQNRSHQSRQIARHQMATVPAGDEEPAEIKTVHTPARTVSGQKPVRASVSTSKNTARLGRRYRISHANLRQVVIFSEIWQPPLALREGSPERQTP